MLRIKKKYFIANFLVLATMLYEVAYIMYVLGYTNIVSAFSIISRNYGQIKILFFLILVCVFFFQFMPIRISTSRRTGIVLCVVVFVLFQVFSLIFKNGFYLEGISEIMIWSLLLINFYLEIRKKNIDISELRNTVYFSFFFLATISVPLIILHLSGNGHAGMVVRPVYFCFTMLPFLLLQKKDRLRTAVIIICGLLLLASSKRTGIIAYVGGLCLYYLLNLNLLGNPKRKIITFSKYLISGAVIVAAVLIYVNWTGSDVIDRFISISEDGGSNRDIIWETILNKFSSLSNSDKWFGRGFHSVSSDFNIIGYQINAHNDFIEILYDFGYIGLFLLVLLYVLLIIFCIKMVVQKNPVAPALSCCVFSLLIFSLFSYGFVQSTTINFLCIFIGYALAQNQISHSERQLP